MLLRLLAALILTALFSVPEALADRLYIDVSAPGIKPLETAAPLLKTIGTQDPKIGRLAISVTELLRKDLSLAGEFNLQDPKNYFEDPQAAPLTPDNTSFEEWRLLGTQILVKGQLSPAEGGEYRIEFHAYDVARKVFIMGKRYRTPENLLLKTANMFVDALLDELTGKPGVFTTEIAFVVKKRPAKNIASIQMNGSGFRLLTQNNSLNLNPVWARDGNSLYLTSYLGGRPDLCRFYIPAKELRYVYRGEGVGMPGEESSDGKTLLFAATNKENTDIYAMDLATHKSQRMTTNRAIDVSPAWSPDGKSFVFVSDMRGTPHIFIADAKDPSAPPKRITFEGKHNGEPAWSPDGEKIAYTGLDENGYFQVYIVDPQGKYLARLPGGSYDTSQPAWSPDGRFLAITSNKDGADGVYVTRYGTNRMWKLSPPGMEANQPAWSYGPVAQ